MTVSEAQEKLFDLPLHVAARHEGIVLTHNEGNMVLISMEQKNSPRAEGQS